MLNKIWFLPKERQKDFYSGSWKCTRHNKFQIDHQNHLFSENLRISHHSWWEYIRNSFFDLLRSKKTTKSGGIQHKLQLSIHQQLPWRYYGLSVISALFLIARIYSTTNLETYEQAKNFFNLTKTQYLSEKSLKEKCHKFIGMCSFYTWFNMQVLNLCHRLHSRIHNPLKYLKWSALWK